MPGKFFDVSGRFDLNRAAPSRKPGTDLVRAPAQEILPPTATPERWHARPAEHLDIPMPGIVRSFWGGLNIHKTRAGIEEHTECVRAVTDNTKAKSELEEALNRERIRELEALEARVRKGTRRKGGRTCRSPRRASTRRGCR